MIDHGSLYPALQRLEEKGWISAEWGTSANNRKARFYTLTKMGRKQLTEETGAWRRLVAAVGRVVDSGGGVDFAMWKKRRSTQDFSEEIRSHLAMEADRLRQEGQSKEDAMLAARRSMGNLAAIEERFHEANHWRWLDQFLQDVRVCMRQWRKRPMMAAVTLLTIALGTGLNVAIFRVVWSALLNPLPYANAAQLVQIWGVEQADGGMSPADRRFTEWIDGSVLEVAQP